jgi:hypothetical protein
VRPSAPIEPAERLLAAVRAGRTAAARHLARRHPELGRAGLFIACVLGGMPVHEAAWPKTVRLRRRGAVPAAARRLRARHG